MFRATILIAVGSFVSGCTAQPIAPGGTSPSVVEASPSGTAEATVVGTYTATLGTLEAPEGAECARGEGCVPPTGRWSISLTDTSLTMTPSLGTYPSQRVTEFSDPSASQGTLRLARSSLPCLLTTGPEGEGEYTWTLSGDTLTLAAVRDDCADRVLILTSEPWTRDSR